MDLKPSDPPIFFAQAKNYKPHKIIEQFKRQTKSSALH
jgi:hypothetical protein